MALMESGITNLWMKDLYTNTSQCFRPPTADRSEAISPLSIDKLEGDPRSRAIGHRAGEWMFERHHVMILRERMTEDLTFIP